eukprot:7922808-Karenia_brevis.AAC.1
MRVIARAKAAQRSLDMMRSAPSHSLRTSTISAYQGGLIDNAERKANLRLYSLRNAAVHSYREGDP